MGVRVGNGGGWGSLTFWSVFNFSKAYNELGSGEEYPADQSPTTNQEELG